MKGDGFDSLLKLHHNLRHEQLSSIWTSNMVVQLNKWLSAINEMLVPLNLLNVVILRDMNREKKEILN